MKITISGKTIHLRLAEPSDADFIYHLRIDPRYNTHLSKVTGTIEDQRLWLMNYKNREEKGSEYYFIITRIDTNEPIGCVRIYDFIDQRKSFCWGSWILNERKTRTAAIESAMLIYQFGFKILCCEQSHFDVRIENIVVNKFHSKFNPKLIRSSELDHFYILSKDDYLSFEILHKKYIED